MAREEARDLALRANAERAMTARYELMIAEMQVQANEPRAASRTACKLVIAKFRGDGAVGVLS